MTKNEQGDWDELKKKQPNSEQPPEPWVYRSRCDYCRHNLGFLALSMCVPQGTPVVCRSCAKLVSP